MELVEREQQNIEVMAAGMLAPLSGNLPEDFLRLQQEVLMIEHMSKVVLSFTKYETGRRLNAMWGKIHGPACRTFGDFMAQWFPNISRRSAYEAMSYAAKTEDLPNFRGLADVKGGWKKSLALLQEVTPAELEDFERTGEIRGLRKKDIEEANPAELKRQLKAALEQAGKLEKEKADLEGEVKDLKARLDQDLDKAVTMVHRANLKCTDALKVLSEIDYGLLVESQMLRELLLGTCENISRIANAVGLVTADANLDAINKEEGN